jgi:hypothetical protein
MLSAMEQGDPKPETKPMGNRLPPQPPRPPAVGLASGGDGGGGRPPKKDRVRINLPPNLSKAPTIKIYTKISPNLETELRRVNST